MAIAMWDFSWLERRCPGGGYQHWGLALDELAERGYDCVRIDAFPHLASEGPDATFDLVPIWDQHDWGAPLPVTVQVQPALNEFIAGCRDRKIGVALSSWFRKDTTDIRMKIDSGTALGHAWNKTLDTIRAAGLLDAIVYLDLCNEWAVPVWAPYMYDWSNGWPAKQLRSSQLVRRWTSAALQTVRQSYPHLDLTFSASDELADWHQQDVTEYDLLEPHIWMAQDEKGEFYTELDYDMRASMFDRHQYEALARHAPALYRSREDYWKSLLRAAIDDCVAHSIACGKPLVTSECWAIVNWKDGPGLDWSWIKDLCAYGVETALATGCWIGMATSNFCGPQFRGMWDDITWHRNLTRQIRAASIPRNAAF